MLNLGVRKAGSDKDIRSPDPAVLREFSVSVIKHVRAMKPFSCSAVANSQSGLLCGMFVLSSSTFSEAISHCAGIGMQLCSSKQLESLAVSGYCNCGRTWAMDGSVMRPHPSVSLCKKCMKCSQFSKDVAAPCSVYYSSNLAQSTEGIVCCKHISSEELVLAMSKS